MGKKKKLEQAERALKVIATWASVRVDDPIRNLKDIENLALKTVKNNMDKPNKND